MRRHAGADHLSISRLAKRLADVTALAVNRAARRRRPSRLPHAGDRHGRGSDLTGTSTIQGGTMPRPLSDAERDAFLAEPHVAVLAIPRGDRPPHITPVWYHHEPGGNVTFFTGTQGRKSRKADLIEESGVVSLCIQRETFPYTYVTIEGSIVQIDRPPTAEQALAIVRRYLPEEQAQGFVAAELDNPSGQFVLFSVRPDHWHSLDFSDATG
jgi:nitroimidazol reductase NimA-like FMN-containing flavoprotein (pyridoxamine 5'-phosphate oxidase superfamily)